MKTKELDKVIRATTKGYVQQSLISDLLKQGSTRGLGDYMATKGYYGSYLTSFNNAIERLRQCGYIVELVPGERGGMWTAYYKIGGINEN